MYYTIMTVIEMDIFSYDGIPVFILLEKRPQRSPCPHIAPSEVSGEGIDVIGTFHHCIIYGNLLAGRENLPDHS